MYRPMCIAIWTRVEEETTVKEAIEGMSVDERVFFVLYIAKPNHHYYYDFPVNYLRNVCIRQIKTSHFMFLDIDMWPTSRYDDDPFIIATLYQHLMQLPDTIFNNSRSTVVIPPVFLKQRKVLTQCRGLHNCFMKYFLSFSLSSRSRQLAPETIPQLEKCIHNDLCILTKEGGFAHVCIIFNPSLLVTC